METLSRGLPKWSDGDDRPPTPDAPNVVAYPFSGLEEVGSTWFLPINSACDCVSAPKGKHIGRCIVKEQMGGARCKDQCTTIM